MLPLLLAATLTIDFKGLCVVTPWTSPADHVARVWVFLPDAVANGSAPHAAKLVIPRRFVNTADWNGSGVWDLTGYTLTILREGVQDAPKTLRTPAPGYERNPWDTLHWTLNLDRIAPQAHIADNPFRPRGAIAAIRLSDGELRGLPPSGKNGPLGHIWKVMPAQDYEQAFADTVRYTVDVPQGAVEFRLDPIPGQTKRSARHIRLTPRSGAATATVKHLPLRAGKTGSASIHKTTNAQSEHSVRGHVAAMAGLFDDASKVSAVGLTRDDGMGGDPICVIGIFHLPPIPCGPNPEFTCPLGDPGPPPKP